MNLLRLLGAISIAFLAASIYGCGGGASSPPAPPPTPTPIPFPTGGFTAATGAITTLTAASNGNFATTLLPASAAGAFIVQAGDSPAAPPQPGSIGQFSISADEWLGLTTLALARTPATSARPNERSIADAHRAVAAEGLHEIPNGQIGVEPLLRTFRPAPPSVRNLSAVRRPRAAVGDQHTFKILYSGIGGAQTQCPNPVPNYVCSVNVPATLEAISQHAYVWVDNTALANAQEFPDTSYFTAAASAFDQYFAIETQDYGPAFATANITTYQQCDSNGTPLPAGQYETPPDLTGQDPHINVIVSDALAGTGEGGYFYSGDFYAQQVLNCAAPPRPVSNEMPSVVIEGDNYSTGPSLPQYNPPYWLGTDMRRSMSHELQHFLHNVNKVYNRIANGLPFVQDNAWIDEGCSMLAEDLAAGAIQIDTPRYTYMYLLEPSQYSLTSFVGYQPSPLTGMGPYGYYFYTAGNYGAAYLFVRYLYDRFGGSTALHAIYADFTPQAIGSANVGPAVAAAGGELWQQLYEEWAIAIAAQSSGVTNDPRYAFNPAVVLRGPVQVTSRRSAPLQVRNLVFGGPQPPRTFDASGNPTGYVQLGIAKPSTITALDGASNFFAAVPEPGGASVRAQTANLPASQGALVQGILPTPMPTSY